MIRVGATALCIKHNKGIKRRINVCGYFNLASLLPNAIPG